MRTASEPPATDRRRPTTRWAAVARLVVVLAALAVVVVPAGPAAAHAVLLGSSPTDGERLDEAPAEVVLTFSEEVSVELGGLRVLDTSGTAVEEGAARQPSPEQVAVSLPDDLATGSYLASYRVVSADGHPVTGAVAFAVGTEVDLAAVAGLGAADDPGMDALAGVARFLAYLGTLVAAGVAGFRAFGHDGAPDGDRLVPVVRAGIAVAVVGAVALVPAQAALATGSGLGAVTEDGVLSAVLAQSGFGWSLATLAAGLVLVGASTVGPLDVVRRSLALYGGVLACASFLLWGHTTAAEPRVVALVADGVHVAVAAVWLGGLIGLGLTLGRRLRLATAAGSDDATDGQGDADVAEGQGDPHATQGQGDADVAAGPGDADATGPRVAGPGPAPDGAPEAGAGDLPDTVGMVLRFSDAAAVSVVLLLVSGAALTWSIGGGPGALTEGTWGRALAGKLLLVGVVLALAGWNRWRLVPSLLEAEADARDTDDDHPSVPTADLAGDPRWRTLRDAVRLEVLALVVVVALTAVLVQATPPADGEGGVYVATLPVTDDLDVELVVSPGTTGTNQVHVTYYAELGRPSDEVLSAEIRLRLPEDDIGPIVLEPPKAGPGHFFTTTDALSVPGTWQVEVVTRLDEFTAERTTTPVPIGSP